MKDKNPYILGTELDELHRLGFQHEVWAEEAAHAMDLLDIKPGNRVLDVGAGPGYCTLPMAYRAGTDGKVMAIDRSEAFMKFLQSQSNYHGLTVDCIQADLEEVEIDKEAFDGIWGRWVLAWVKDADPILKKLVDALKPGGKMIFQEYYDWKTFQTEPHSQALHLVKEGILKSFAASEGFINIGRRLPIVLSELGMTVISVRPYAKLSLPGTKVWYWIKTFLQIYGPKVVHAGHLEQETLKSGLSDLDRFEAIPGSTILGPLVIEVVATKP